MAALFLLPRSLGVILNFSLFFFHIPHLVGCEIHWNTSQMWSFLTPSIRTFLRSTCLNCSFLFNSQFWDMFSTHQMGLSLRIYVILFHSSFLGPLFPSHSEFLLKSLLWPYCPCMLWPWLFLWSSPLSLTSLHSALDPWPLASGNYTKLASAAESLLGMPLPGCLKFCFLVPFRNLLTCHSFPDPIWNKDHSGMLCVYDLLSISAHRSGSFLKSRECHIHGQMPSIKNSPWHIEGAH